MKKGSAQPEAAKLFLQSREFALGIPQKKVIRSRNFRFSVPYIPFKRGCKQLVRNLCRG